MKICLTCRNIFDEQAYWKLYNEILSTTLCPICSNGEIKDIDELVLPLSLLLDDEGIIVNYACAGHNGEDIISPYIAFEYDTLPFKITNKQLPKGWKREEKGLLRFEPSTESLSLNEPGLTKMNLELATAWHDLYLYFKKKIKE